MFSIGSTIKDNEGHLWIVTETWTYQDYLCLALIGSPGTRMMGQMGGARFKSGEAILIRR